MSGTYFVFRLGAAIKYTELLHQKNQTALVSLGKIFNHYQHGPAVRIVIRLKCRCYILQNSSYGNASTAVVGWLCRKLRLYLARAPSEKGFQASNTEQVGGGFRDYNLLM